MASRSIEVTIVGDSKSLERAFGRSEKATGKLGRSFHAVGKLAAVAGASITAAVVVGVEKSVHAALDMEASQARLATAFKNQRINLDRYKKGIDAAEEAGRKLGFTDEQTNDSLGSLITATGSYAKAVKDLGVVQDFTRLKHVDASDATKTLTMAMTGSQRAVKALGIVVIPLTDHYRALADNATAAEKAHAKLLDKYETGQAVIDKVSEKVRGQAQAFADTNAGGLAQFRAGIDHLEVALGTKLLPKLATAIEKITVFGTWLGKHPTLFKAMIAGLLGYAAAATVATVAQTALDIAMIPMIGTISLVAIGLGSLAIAAALVIKKWDQFKRGLERVWAAMRSSPISVLGARLGTLGGAVHAVTTAFSWLAHAIQASVDAVESLISALGRIHVPSIHLPSLPSGIHIGGHAGGVQNWRGGWSMVGERGPELVNLPRGSDVYPHGTGPAGIEVHFHSTFPPSEQQAAEAARGVSRGLRRQGSVPKTRFALGV